MAKRRPQEIILNSLEVYARECFKGECSKEQLRGAATMAAYVLKHLCGLSTELASSEVAAVIAQCEAIEEAKQWAKVQVERN